MYSYLSLLSETLSCRRRIVRLSQSRSLARPTDFAYARPKQKNKQTNKNIYKALIKRLYFFLLSLFLFLKFIFKMAKINSAITFIGKIGNINGYNRAGSIDKTFVRLNGGATKEQFLTSSSMIRTRENANEFSGISALSGNINRHIPRHLRQKGGKTFYYILKNLRNLLVANNSGKRGYRSLLVSSEAFNSLFFHGSFSAHFFENTILSPYSINYPSNHQIEVIFDLGILHSEIITPAGATHYQISLNAFYLANRVYDYTLKSYIIQSSYDSELFQNKTTFLDITNDVTTFSLNIDMINELAINQEFIAFISIAFFQLIGTDYILYGGAADTIIACIHL